MLGRYGENPAYQKDVTGEPLLSKRSTSHLPSHEQNRQWDSQRAQPGRIRSTAPFRRMSSASNPDDPHESATAQRRPESVRHARTQLKSDHYTSQSGGSQGFRYPSNTNSSCRPTSLSDASDSDWDANKAKRKHHRLQRMWDGMWNMITKPCYSAHERLASTCKTYRRLRNAHKELYEMQEENRMKVMFMVSTLLGGIVFLLIFEAMHMTFSFYLEDMTAESIWMLAYVMAYVVSIIWQHSLNQWLVFTAPNNDQGYCESLCLTFSVYAVTLLTTTLAGAFMMTRLQLMDHPQIVMVLTLPISGVINFYLLRWAFDYSAANPDLGDFVVL